MSSSFRSAGESGSCSVGWPADRQFSRGPCISCWPCFNLPQRRKGWWQQDCRLVQFTEGRRSLLCHAGCQGCRAMGSLLGKEEVRLKMAGGGLPAISALLLVPIAFGPVSAHPGGLAADGCHNDRKNGGRHCHGGSAAPQRSTPPRQQFSSSRSVYFANCSDARAAGAAPVRRGDPGYASHLDRDSDGIGCE